MIPMISRLTNFLNRHLFSVACAPILASSLFLLSVFNADMQGDVKHYRGIADDAWKGSLPYRDTVVEYPPYAIPIFLLPRILGDDDYLDSFIALAFAGDWAIKLCLFSITLRQSKTIHALLPLLLYCLAIPFIRFFLLQRYDLFPAFICLMSIWLFYSRRFFLCGLAIAMGFGVKLYPILFVPPLVILAFRQNQLKSFVTGMVVGLLPLLWLSFYLPWWRFAQFQADRGLQVESLYASALWLGNLLGRSPVNWVHTKMWYEVQGPAASTLLPWSRVIFVGAVLFSLLLTIRATWLLAKPSLSQLTRILLLPLLAFVSFNQVLSPQYMIWLLPLAALTALEGSLWCGIIIALATALTPIIYPSWHGNYGSGLDLFETIILVLRNLMLVITWAWLFCKIFTESNFQVRNSKPAF